MRYEAVKLIEIDTDSATAARFSFSFEPDLADRLGFSTVEDPDTIVDSWRQEHPGATVGVMAAGTVYRSHPS